eukprot:c9465_g1_i1.p1 GENE.c9465_g1_i1~~c9465_g1_i1.p1  ORF type:complete len:547 (+),score=122.93 c9465_g1_i1:158-1642(+)
MIARPKFNHFNSICETLHSITQKLLVPPPDGASPPNPSNDFIVRFPSQNCGDLPTGIRINASTNHGWPEFHVKETDYVIQSPQTRTPEPPRRPSSLDLTPPAVPRTKILERVGSTVVFESDGMPMIECVFFPLIALIIPTWLKMHPEPSEKIVYLVSGAGLPRNAADDMESNSTKFASKMIAKFIRYCYQGVKVEHFYSGTGIFRFDENVTFINNDLRPRLEAKRRELADGTSGWAQRFKVTLVLSGGAPARVIAINSAMKQFHPDYIHVWQLKTFWHEYPNILQLHDEDVDIHTFEKIDGSPSCPIELADPLVQLLAKHVRSQRDAFLSAQRAHQTNELKTFWLRKTRKPVLCVLMISTDHSTNTLLPSTGDSDAMEPLPHLNPIHEESYLFYRGINTEVSMPTGSLCAERCAISTAFATQLTLSRSDFVMLGVLSMAISGDSEPEDEIAMNPLGPCGACMEWLRKVAEVNPDFRIVTFTNTRCDHVFVNPVL